MTPSVDHEQVASSETTNRDLRERARIDVAEQTTKLDPHELARQMVKHLGPTLVALLANVRDRKLPHKWAKADGPTPRDEAYTRLFAARLAWMLISTAESDDIARSWFIGSNPRLGDESPALRLREGQIVQVMSAAKAFVDGMDG